jgi:hypothetical protein
VQRALTTEWLRQSPPFGESGSDKQHGLTGPTQMNFNAFHTIHSMRRFSHSGPLSFTMTVQMLAASK